MIKVFIGIAICSILLVSCSQDQREKEIIRTYLHLSHTHTWKGPQPNFDTVVKSLDLTAYDVLMLGGDLLNKTSKNAATMAYADSVFHISQPNTLWSIGNHDDHHVDLVEAGTGRNDFFVYNSPEACFMILNTQCDTTSIIGEQLDMFNSVLDTIQPPTKLFLLHHKLLWMWNHPELHDKMWQVTNGGTGEKCEQCINPNNFYTDLYPRLVEARQRGVEILSIAGDIGYEVREFAYETTERIHYLASGIEAGEPGNKALLFKHYLHKDSLAWEFVPIESLKKNR